jgi:hypothetical protein
VRGAIRIYDVSVAYQYYQNISQQLFQYPVHVRIKNQTQFIRLNDSAGEKEGVYEKEEKIIWEQCRRESKIQLASSKQAKKDGRLLSANLLNSLV